MDRISTAGVAFQKGCYFVALRKPGTAIGESWEFPGGKCEPGEAPEEALKREFMEELSLEVSVHELIYLGSFHNGCVSYTLQAYKVMICKGNPELLEHSRVRWVMPEELESLTMAGSDAQIRDYLLKKS